MFLIIIYPVGGIDVEERISISGKTGSFINRKKPFFSVANNENNFTVIEIKNLRYLVKIDETFCNSIGFNGKIIWNTIGNLGISLKLNSTLAIVLEWEN
jgi:hypothetical protein